MVEKNDLPRIRQIQHELKEIDSRQKNLLQELFTLMGIRVETATRNTKKNRLSKDEFRRLCGC